MFSNHYMLHSYFFFFFFFNDTATTEIYTRKDTLSLHDALPISATHARVLTAQAEAARLEVRTWAAVLVALGAAVGLALLGTAVIAQRMTRSLDLLSSATAEVAAGAFHEPIVVESRDEIAALARSFNSMASQLREVEEMKTEFFATVSHELRSPLTSIRGAADLVHEGIPGPLTPRQARLIDIISQSSERRSEERRVGKECPS